MLKVLLVDDEPFILQGLEVLVNWGEEDFEITGTAHDGREALEFLENNSVDLILADINMPVVSGLELLKRIREEEISNAFFVILSGYADFSYAQEAIKYKCTDYILKPVEKEQLLETLRKAAELKANKEEETKESRKFERAYLARNLIAVIGGKYDNVNLMCVKEQMRFSEALRYVEIELDEEKLDEDISDENKRAYQRKLAEICIEFLGGNADHCVFDVSGKERVYDIGFVYCDYMARESMRTERGYLGEFMSHLKRKAAVPVIMLVGKIVDDIKNIAKSYSTVCMLRSCKGFESSKDIYYYDDEIQVPNDCAILCKDEIDTLLSAIEQNQQVQIRQAVDVFFEAMQQTRGG